MTPVERKPLARRTAKEKEGVIFCIMIMDGNSPPSLWTMDALIRMINGTSPDKKTVLLVGSYCVLEGNRTTPDVEGRPDDAE